ncbi:ATP-binding cassette domain-containing protein [bacterium]|nr:ATP-binding cassette domain-containing protein [candidate division CSSED10-310 bacterium]
MAIISLHSVSFSYSGPPLLQDLTLHVEAGERVCIIGRNGAGKSSLLGLIARDLIPAEGMVETVEELQIGYLPQIVPADLNGSVYEIVAAGLGSIGKILIELHRHNKTGIPMDSMRLETLHRELGEFTEWDLEHRIERTIHTCKLDPDDRTEPMSAGMKRRVLLARAMVANPDVLLLDEPTNHLDIPTIQWLEDYLLASGKTLVFITHDRMLLSRLATRIVEIDRGRLHNWGCDYAKYTQRRDELLTTENRQKQHIDKKLRTEEEWLHRGVKARGTRNEGRVKALKQLRLERKAWRELTGSVHMRIQEAQRSGKLVIDAEDVSFSYGDMPIIRNFNTTVLRSDRIGIMGPNGCGKSTLLKLMLGELKPLTGLIRFGTNLNVAYFDQLREQLDPDQSIIDSIAGGLREVTIGGRSRHIYSYLKDFLFDPSGADALVKTLSGGERNRLLLARLFIRPSNLLVLDEPTNDLDADTLDILEDQLMDYAGTVLVVSHDRTFLNNVVTATLVFEPDGSVGEYAGGYDDWLLQRNSAEPVYQPTETARTPRDRADTGENRGKPAKLSYMLSRELAALPDEIDQLETDIDLIYDRMSAPDYYLNDPESMRATQLRLNELESLLEARIARWAELDDLSRRQ